MPGTLYVLATPIGNLGDLSPRAAETLANADFIAAEDTRVTLKLLNHLGLKKPLVSYNRHNAEARGEQLLGRIAQGENCALCSDAGTPAISDPGEQLVTAAHRLGITVVPVVGPCAAIAALSAAGRPTGRFAFEGFVSQNKRLRAARLESLREDERTLVFYEAPHKLSYTLRDLCHHFGPERPLTVCRELTKLHEQIWPTTLGEAAAFYGQNTPKGELGLVMGGAAPRPEEPGVPLQEAARLAKKLARDERLSASEAARRAAAATGHSKSSLYRLMQTMDAGEGT